MTDPGASPDPPAVSIPPDARDRAVELLTRAYADDRLPEVEFEALLDRVYRAKTLTELRALTENLPVLRSAAEMESTGTEAVGAARSATAEAPTQITALLAAQQRTLTGTVPQHLRLRARLGHIELDLTRATFAPGITVIEVRALLGHVEVRLPDDIPVETDGRAFLGHFSLLGAGTPPPPGTDRLVHITGRAVLGHAECIVSTGGQEHREGR